jgi:hypothetical protein
MPGVLYVPYVECRRADASCAGACSAEILAVFVGRPLCMASRAVEECRQQPAL